MGLLEDFTTGVSRLPYRVIGAPVDLMSALMSPLGYKVKKPVMGSEWLIDQGIKSRLARERTGSGAELAGDVVSGLLDPSPTTEMALASKLGGLLGDPVTANKIGGGLLEALTVFHGSPHRINNVTPDAPYGKFDMSKIGTGEGAQAYGHGIYLAENPRVAKEYAEKLSVNASWPMSGYNSVEKASPALLQEIAAAVGDDPSRINRAIIKPSEFREIGPDLKKRINAFKKDYRGNFYTVDLPDEQIAKMLDWDAPLSEQAIKGAITPEGMGLTLKELPSGYMGFVDDTGKPVGTFQKGGTPESFRARWIENAQKQTGQSVYGWLSTDKQQASKLLQRAGIPGIKYFDGGSRAAGEGTRNFVIFDPDVAKILKRE